MKVTIQVDDALYEKYAGRASELAARKPGATLSASEVMAAQLDRFKDVDPIDRIVIVDTKRRGALEEILGGGSLMNAEDLVVKVKRLAKIEIGGIAVQFTPGQLEELKNRAARNRLSVQELTQRTVRGLSENFFNALG